MLNIWDLAPNDQSIYYLGQIFGAVGDVLPMQPGGSYNLIFGVMFKVFNTIALTAGAVILVYTTVVGLLATAHEGEFLGKRWGGAGAIWLPIRMVLGVGLLFPGASGYSAIQIIVMWIIVQGIAAADTLWTATLNYISTTTSPFGTFSQNTTQVQTAMESLFQVLVCQESARATNYSTITVAETKPVIEYKWYCSTPEKGGTPFCKYTNTDLYNVINGPQTNNTDSSQQPNQIKYKVGPVVGPDGLCGSVVYSNPDANINNPDSQLVCQAGIDGHSDTDTVPWGPNSLICLSYQGQQQALQSIVPVFSAIAQQYVMTDYQYVYFMETPVSPPGTLTNPGQTIVPEPVDWIQTYCSTPTTQGGLGITDPNQCCHLPSSYCQKSGSFNPDYSGQASNPDTGNTSDAAVTSAYLPFSMQPYLGANLDFINAATSQFIQQGITGPYQNYIATLGTKNLAGTSLEIMQGEGWLMAGSYFFRLANQASGTVSAIKPTLIVNTQTQTTNFPYRSNQTSASTLISAINEKGGALQETGLSAISPKASKVRSTVNDIVSIFVRNISDKSGKQPLVSLSKAGWEMMAAAQFLFLTITVIAMAVMGGLSFANFVAIGTGFTLNPGYETIRTGLGMLTPFIVILISALFSIGALLGIYLPLVPYLVYVVTAIGWFIAVIEAMIAAPLIALGILSPGGQHELMGHADKSLMILFNLFLRPTLMVFGFIAAILLSSVVIEMFNVGFVRTAGQIMKDNTVGLVEQIVFMAVYCSLVLIIVNKVFSLIHMIPERALTYIGGQPIGYGEAEALGTARQAVSGAAGGLGGGAKQTGAAGAAFGRAKGREMGAKDVQQRAGADVASPEAKAIEKAKDKGDI